MVPVFLTAGIIDNQILGDTIEVCFQVSVRPLASPDLFQKFTEHLRCKIFSHLFLVYPAGDIAENWIVKSIKDRGKSLLIQTANGKYQRLFILIEG